MSNSPSNFLASGSLTNHRSFPPVPASPNATSEWESLERTIRNQWNATDRQASCGHIPDSDFIRDLIRIYARIAFPQLNELEPEKRSEQKVLLRDQIAMLHRSLETLNLWALTQPDRARPLPTMADARSRAAELASHVLRCMPATIQVLQTDLDAAMNGDPACRSREEVLICYPGFRAIMVHRIAHQLYRMDSRLAARVMAEWVHGETGIDIHPGASIGNNFFIDHGTGVVIGETCVVGNRVRIYQGVTLGALNFPRTATGELIRDNRRHPTIGDDVVIYANASILGGETVIGDRCLIGSSVWLTESVPADTRVVMEKPRLRIRSKGVVNPEPPSKDDEKPQ